MIGKPATAEPFGLTNAQKALWASQMLHPDTPLYNMAFAWTIDGAVDEPSFKAAFGRLVADADSLRTVVGASDGVPFQRVEPSLEFELPIIDMSQTEDPSAAADRWTRDRCSQPIDMERRTFDAALLRLADDRYVWYLCQHHVVSDAAAFAILYHQMEQHYRHLRSGDVAPDPLPEYAEYVAYEASVRESPSDQRTAANGPRDIVAPSLYGAQPRRPSTANERVAIELSESRSADLRELAGQPGIQALTLDMGLFQLFVTAFFAYLHRVSGQSKITIGAPVHNRATADFRRSDGLFMEVYPFTVEVADDDSFSTLYDKVRTAAAAFLRSAKPGQSTTEANRQINSVLNYITATFDLFDGLPVGAEWIHPGHVDAHHHLRLQVSDFAATGRFNLAFDISTEALASEIRSAVAGHFQNVLEAMIERWDQPISDVDLTTKAEKAAVLAAVNGNSEQTPATRDVIAQFLDRVRQTPGAAAIVADDRTWSYADADRITRSLAAGIEPGSVVGVALPRSPEAVLSMVGILRAGAAYVPIDPSWPQERVKFIVEDANCSLVITDTPRDLGVTSVQFEDALAAATPNGRSIDGADLAYILYTSGSTGKPKGVMVEHGSLANYVSWASGFYDRGQGLTFPLFTPLTFDLTITSIFVPLVSGGTIRVYPETSEQGDLAVLEVFEENAVDIVKLTPSHLALLPEREPRKARIAQLIIGGEDLTTATARRAHRRFLDGVLIHNEYGPTEATVGCIVQTFDPSSVATGSVPIGHPIANMRAYVLDRQGQPVPFGVPGELHVAGAGVARGYAGRPDLTKAKFTANKAVDEARLYATGDLARVGPDGVIAYLGRRDDQLKVRGVRVELGEIEAAVASHPDVVAAAANVWINEPTAETAQLEHCVKCGLPSNYPGVAFDTDGICNECRAFAGYKERAHVYFKPEEQLAAILESGRAAGGEYDCLALLSGGKDSTYVLGRLADMGLRVLAFTLDNGYISDQAKQNIRRVVETLGVDHVFATTPAMNEIFVDSLQRHANVCNGCFKAIYTLSMQTAREKRIPFIVTGLSRGQFFETRLTKELFTDLAVTSDEIDSTVLDARKAYHHVDDAVKRLMDVSVFDDETIFDEVQYVDFYRYVDVGLDELYAYLDERLPWVRPSDTGRSTNCLINDVSIYYHRKVRGYHNYALPYSWDVRVGHKTRDEALEELDDEIDVAEVGRILDEIGFPGDITDYESGQRLVSYYVAPVDIPTPKLKEHVSATLPRQLIPSQFVRLDRIPLTANGKVDKAALPLPEDHRRSVDTAFVAARTETEAALAAIWEEILGVVGIGVKDNYFDLGGDSIMAIQIVARANREGIEVTLHQLFETLTIDGLAVMAEAVTAPSAESSLPAEELPEVSADQLQQLASILDKLEAD